VNSDSGEGYIVVDGNEGDRNNLTLWRNGDTLIQNVSANCNNTIVVIHSTGPVLVDAWYSNPNVTAILWAGLPGEQSGNSIADVLYGRVNPGAKLPFTMGASRTDYGTDVIYEPNNGNAAPQDNFVEGVFIDYRSFDKNDITPVYEFGFGLSYTTFSYSNINIINATASPYTPTTGMTKAAPVLGSFSNDTTKYQFPPNLTYVATYIYPYLNSTSLSKASEGPDYGLPTDKYIPAGATDGSPQPRIAAGGGPGGNPELWDVLFTVKATIANTGSIPGEEVVQMYVSLGGPDDPKVVLRGFERLSIQAGHSAEFSADITRRDVSNWDTATQNWVISSYPKKVYVGSSSRKLLLSGDLDL
jgi:beta-glucosidase